MKKETLESLWMLLATGIFATCNAVIKYAAVGGFSFWEIVMWRAIFSCIVLYTIMRMRGISILTQYPGLYAMRTLTGSSGTVCSVAAVSMIPLGMANTLCNTTPIFMGVTFAALAFMKKQKQDWLVLGNILIGFFGILMVLQPSADAAINPMGAAAGIGAALLDVCAYWSIKRLGQLGEPTERMVFWFSAVCALMGFAGCLATGFSALTPEFIGLMALIGTIHVAAMYAMTRAWAFGYIPLSGTLAFGTVIFCVLFGWLIFGDRLSALQLAGIATVIGSGIVSTLARLRNPRKS